MRSVRIKSFPAHLAKTPIVLWIANSTENNFSHLLSSRRYKNLDEFFVVFITSTMISFLFFYFFFFLSFLSFSFPESFFGKYLLGNLGFHLFGWDESFRGLIHRKRRNESQNAEMRLVDQAARVSFLFCLIFWKGFFNTKASEH